MLKSEWYEMLKEVETYLYNLQKASVSVGDLFYDNITVEVISVLESYVNGHNDIAQSLYFVVEESEPFYPDFKNAFSKEVEKLSNFLVEIKQVLSQENYVMLADLMRYEINEHISNIITKLKEFNYSE